MKYGPFKDYIFSSPCGCYYLKDDAAPGESPLTEDICAAYVCKAENKENAESLFSRVGGFWMRYVKGFKAVAMDEPSEVLA